MNVLNANFFKLSNTLFFYGLKPVQLAAYSYLVSCAGQKEVCYPSMKTIAGACGCAENTVRGAVERLEELGFIRKVATYVDYPDGRTRQSNNMYHILPMPKLPSRPAPVYREAESA